MVGLGRLELPTSRLSSARSNQLSYKPEVRDQMSDVRNQPVLTSDLRHLSSECSFAKKEKRRRRAPSQGSEIRSQASRCRSEICPHCSKSENKPVASQKFPS